GLLLVGAGTAPPPDSASTSATSAETADPALQGIADLQAELKRVPGNYPKWSTLGMAYLQQARLTADPTLYGKAEAAFDMSLQLRPSDNDAALTGQATLAAARHDFAGALALTDQSLAINDFSATTYAVRFDALNELGRYDEARAAVQRVLDLRPGLDALVRASYALELRGDVEGARDLLQQAASDGRAPGDIAFAQYYLGELAWNNGDLEGARGAYQAALAADPGYLAAVAGRAKVAAASGDPQAAERDYQRVVQQLPSPEFLVAYGELLESTGQSDAAQEQYAVVRATQRLYAANGQDVDTELALFEADHGTPAAAVASAEKAYATRPLAVLTQDAYAWALHSAGRSEEALPIARQAARLGLRSPVLAYHLGAIEAAVGDPVAARTSLRRALDLNPAFNPLQAPKARALLATLG
ncbi:MAG: tetratricopeptide repeat protein, partial [Actinobacteria bacterium]|nr:tetratricopeptide repeat protein [Actinomycetota bacterium]MBW3647731.1 tetratricopeptide repeat protein [Actinomycetota bacterium]